jgi:hypothetical protein
VALSPQQIVARLAPLVGRVGAAGIAGNLMQESSDDPGRVGGGLAQWQGPRYTGLVKYAQSRGLPATSAEAALGYLEQDLKGPYSGLTAQLRAAKDPAHAATLFSAIYERPGVPMLGNRINYARQALGAAPRGALPAGPGIAPQSAGPRSVTARVPTFDQAGYQKANARYIAGSFLAGEKNPFDIGPKGADTGPNPLFAQGALTTTAPNIQDFQGTKTVHLAAATGALQKMAGTSLVNTHPGAKGYVNPIPGAVIGRTDMGVDANLKVGAPIRAIGDSRVVGISPNWYKGQPYVLLQLLSGPQKGKFYYVAEQIAPTVRAGQTLRVGQPIGRYAQSGTGIEIGWGSPSPGRTLAQATSGYSEGQQTQAGSSFRNFLGSL